MPRRREPPTPDRDAHRTLLLRRLREALDRDEPAAIRVYLEGLEWLDDLDDQEELDDQEVEPEERELQEVHA